MAARVRGRCGSTGRRTSHDQRAAASRGEMKCCPWSLLPSGLDEIASGSRQSSGIGRGACRRARTIHVTLSAHSTNGRLCSSRHPPRRRGGLPDHATKPTDKPSAAQWRSRAFSWRFTVGTRGRTSRSASLSDGKLRGPTRAWATEALVYAGQVWYPNARQARDVNPRPVERMWSPTTG